jgi:stalled ribosome rescue protein Dom34
MYYIYDEMGDLMRIVRRQEEAKMLISCRNERSFVRVQVKRKTIDLSKFEDALV